MSRDQGDDYTFEEKEQMRIMYIKYFTQGDWQEREFREAMQKIGVPIIEVDNLVDSIKGD